MNGDNLTTPPPEHNPGDDPSRSPGRSGERTLFDGRYRLHGFLGRGSAGEVYDASDTALDGTRVALKLFTAQGAAAISEARLQREARVLFSLSHPNIVRALAVGRGVTEDGMDAPYLVLELLHGRSLYAELREGPLPPERSLPVLAQLASALAYLHGQGVIHRDLKPSNIVLAEDGTVTLLDFGIARADDPHGSLRSISDVGTVPYLAPELYNGAAATPQSDVYAFGLLALELSAGISMDGQVVGHHHRAARLLERAVNLPGWLLPVVRRCVARNPFDRFADGGELQRALLRAQALDARPHVIGRLVRRRVRRSSQRSVAGTIVTTVIASLFISCLGWNTGPGWVIRDVFGPHGHANLRYLTGQPLVRAGERRLSDEEREQLFCECLEKGDEYGALILVREGTTKCSAYPGYNALKLAARNGMTGVVKELLAQGVDPDEDLLRQSAASMALGNNQLRTFRLLRAVGHGEYCALDAARLTHACDPDFLLEFLRAGGTFGDGLHGCVGAPSESTLAETILDIGCRHSMEIVLRHGSFNPEAIRKIGGEPLLSSLAYYGAAERIAVLLRYKVNPQLPGPYTTDAIHNAIATPVGALGTIRMLLDSGQVVLARRTHRRQSYAYTAVLQNNPDALALLLRSPADAISADVDGTTPLDVAVDPMLRTSEPELMPRWQFQNPFGDEEGMSVQLAALLLVAGADPARVSPDGLSAIERARRSGCARCVELFERARFR